MPVPQRHWLTHGNNCPLPTGAQALDEPFAAFPSWCDVLIECVPQPGRNDAGWEPSREQLLERLEALCFSRPVHWHGCLTIVRVGPPFILRATML